MKIDFLLNSPPKSYWNKRSVQFQQGAPFFDKLPNAEQLVEILSGAFIGGEWIDPINININASRLSDNGSHLQMLSIGVEDARQSFRDGFSLCFSDLSQDISSLSELRSESSKLFDQQDLIVITGYLSPKGAVGVLHFDRQHNFFIQTEGVKRWFVSEKAAISNPYDNLVYTETSQKFFDNLAVRGYKVLMPRDCGRVEYDLEPGDVLYIPPGFYHSPETLSDFSLHYTLTIEPACFWRGFNNRLFDVMLANNVSFLEDYRFLNDIERTQLFEKCLQLANKIELSTLPK